MKKEIDTRVVVCVWFVLIFCLQSVAQSSSVLEAVQINSERTRNADEKRVSGYFVFDSPPSDFSYRLRKRDRKLVFEFVDVKKGASPVISVRESPVRGFEVEQVRDDKKGVQRDITRVIFDLDAPPVLDVKDERGTVSFSFLWSDNPHLQPKYKAFEITRPMIIWSGAGLGAVGLGVMSIFLFRDGESTGTGLSRDDLPARY